MNNKYEILQIFPTPIYRTFLDRELSEKEKKILLNKESILKNNIGNKTSDNTYILKNKNLKDLSKFLDYHIRTYFIDVLKTKKVKPYITQSWLNNTSLSEYHHEHSHPNSIISGVFYVDVNDSDKISFIKKDSSSFMFEVDSYNAINSYVWDFMVQKNDLLLFPSSTIHKVKIKDVSNSRISLAFNVFAKGVFGNKNELTELILK